MHQKVNDMNRGPAQSDLNHLITILVDRVNAKVRKAKPSQCSATMQQRSYIDINTRSCSELTYGVRIAPQGDETTPW